MAQRVAGLSGRTGARPLQTATPRRRHHGNIIITTTLTHVIRIAPYSGAFYHSKAQLALRHLLFLATELSSDLQILDVA
jgi:hypothetical protein